MDRRQLTDLQWVQVVTVDDLPRAPIRLNHYTTIVDTEKWLETLRREAIRYGVDAPRFLSGAFQAEVKTIRDITEGDYVW